MDKKKASEAIEAFRNSFTPAVFDGNAPATKGDVQKLANQVVKLAEKLLEASSN